MENNDKSLANAAELPSGSTVDIGEVVPLPGAETSSLNQSSVGDSATLEEGLFSSNQPQLSFDDFTALFSLPSLATDGFNWRTALSLAVASKLAYYDQENVEDTVKDTWGLVSCKFIHADDTQCFIASTGDNVLISFRGTDEKRDWLTNINIAPTTREYGKVHRGFLNGFNAVRQLLEEELSQLETSKVLLTGHSLGGALSTVAAAEWSGTYPISGVYTFGQPAVGRGDFRTFFSTQYSDKFFRFVNDDDVVSRIPPNYRHIGQLLHFDAQGTLKSPLESNNLESIGTELISVESDDSESDMMTEAEFEAFREALESQAATSANESLEGAALEGFLPSVRDHSMDGYIGRIGGQIP